MSNNFNELKPKIALGVAAHPDDLDMMASGTFAKWAKEGAEVYYLIITDGSKGSDDPNLTSESLKVIREDEQKNAADKVGCKDVIFLKYPDAMLEVTLNLKKDIVRVIRKLKPDVVVTFDPSILYSLELGFINHTDHRAAGLATVDAVFPLSRDRLTFSELLEEGLEPHKVSTLLLTNFDNNNFYVDITHSIDEKMAAIAAHASQFNDIPSIQSRMKAAAQKLGGKSGVSYAEGFLRFDLF